MLMKIFMWWFRLKKWKIEGGLPEGVNKCVLIAAPHTSNWDFVYGMGALGYFGYNVKYLAKKELFRFPFGWVFYKTGGMPVDRTRPNALVATVTEEIQKRDDLVVMFPPEGTRKKVRKWKTGFYYTALGSNLPISMGFLDYKRKVASIGPLFNPTGNIKEDFDKLRAFYKNITPKNPENFQLPENE